jgi:nucleotide-binding universal stress UspA family protein
MARTSHRWMDDDGPGPHDDPGHYDDDAGHYDDDSTEANEGGPVPDTALTRPLPVLEQAGRGWAGRNRDDRTSRPLVVGLDGSPGGERALEWALREALLRGAGLRVVTVWTWEGYGSGDPLQPTGSGERRAHQVQQVQLARVLARVEGPLPPVEAELVQGDPACRLMENSCDADLLVLGSRGNSAVHDTLMGSVAEVCVRHAGCPVVVVPSSRQVVLPCRTPVRGLPGSR